MSNYDSIKYLYLIYYLFYSGYSSVLTHCLISRCYDFCILFKVIECRFTGILGRSLFWTNHKLRKYLQHSNIGLFNLNTLSEVTKMSREKIQWEIKCCLAKTPNTIKYYRIFQINITHISAQNYYLCTPNLVRCLHYWWIVNKFSYTILKVLKILHPYVMCVGY